MLVYFGNTLNLHQLQLSDALYELNKGDYIYVETVAPRKDNFSGGKLKAERPYVLAAYKDKKAKEEAIHLAKEADVVFLGANSFEYQVERMRQKQVGLTFEGSERWLKRGWVNIFSPRLFKYILYYHFKQWNKKPLYKLCASAFCAGDHYKLHSFKNRCYKWGYFTKVTEINIDDLIDFKIKKRPSIMWCARFLDWKHPEMAVELAQRLKESNYDVMIDMYGTGVQLSKVEAMARNLGVEEMVSFKGNHPNEEIINAMHNHDIFLFTSDRNEGWGAVLNEAMSNGCTVVASNEIGSVPFLVKDGVNGQVFKSGDLDSLYSKVVYLLEHPEQRAQMAREAYKTMINIWSPRQAAMNLMQLIDDLKQGRDTAIAEGPCSKAFPIL